MNKIVTVKDLKEWLKNIPDDAYVYWQELLRDRDLQFVTPIDKSTTGYNSYTAWRLPYIYAVPLDNKAPQEHIEALIELDKKWI